MKATKCSVCRHQGKAKCEPRQNAISDLALVRQMSEGSPNGGAVNWLFAVVGHDAFRGFHRAALVRVCQRIKEKRPNLYRRAFALSHAPDEPVPDYVGEDWEEPRDLAVWYFDGLVWRRRRTA